MDNTPHFFTIKNIARIGQDKVALTLMPDKPFVYQAGQYVEIMFNGKEARPYSIANAPNEDGSLEIHVRDANHGGASSYAHSIARTGEKVMVRGPFGSCFYDPKIETMVLLAGGIGITQFKAMIEEAIQRKHKGMVCLYWSAKEEDDLYLRSYFHALTNKHKLFIYNDFIEENFSIGGANFFKNPLLNAVFYLSGPAGMIESASIQLKNKGILPNLIKSDMSGIIKKVFENPQR